MISGFHHVALKTRDWDRTLRFYCDVLGCTPKVTWQDAPQRAAMLELPGGNYVEVFEDLAYHPNPDGAIVHFAFRTDRIEAVAEKVRAFGARITLEPKSLTIPNKTALGPVPVTILFCEGPNGEIVEFLQNALT